MSGRMEGRVALVTGASRGIGLAVARTLAGEGARVAMTARRVESVQAEAETIPGALALAMDVSDHGSVAEGVRRVESELGAVQILVNNAGITQDQLLLRMKPEDFDRVVQTNLYGTFHCTRAVAKGMVKARWGRIVNISSVVGVIGNPGQSNYAASKAGILGFTRSVARELASRNITANAVAPGFIETAMTEGLPESSQNALFSQIPLGRFGSSTDVAGAVAFLASEDAAYITGQVLHVDGGMVMS